MSQALVTITQSRPAQTFRVGYDMPAKEFESGADVLAHSQAIRERFKHKPAPVARAAIPEPYRAEPKPRKPHDFIFLKQMNGEKGTPRWNMSKHDRILRDAASGYSVTVGEICGARRNRAVVAARYYAFYRMSNELGYSLPMIGKVCGDRDHTTVLHGLRCYEAKLRGEVYTQPRYGKAKAAAEAAQQ